MPVKLSLLMLGSSTHDARLLQLKATIVELQLGDAESSRLLDELRCIPTSVRDRERRICDGENPDAFFDPDRTSHRKPTRRELADLVDPSANPDDLTESQLHTARGRLRRMRTKRLGLLKTKHQHPYTALIRQFILSIEAATGRRFRYWRDTNGKSVSSASGTPPPIGPMFHVLEAALELALFGSVTARDYGIGCGDFPAKDTIAHVADRRRESGYACRRRLNIDPPCRLNFDPGMVLPAVLVPAVDNCSSYLLSSARA